MWLAAQRSHRSHGWRFSSAVWGEGFVSVGALISQWCVQLRAAAQCVPGATNEAVVTAPISTAVAYLVLAAVNDVWQARASKVGQHLCVPQFATQRC